MNPVASVSVHDSPAPAEDRYAATSIPLRMHPRVFAALGADLVTNDVVAVIELVKNSYDAYANNVWVRIVVSDGEPTLEIEDDGLGMTKATIQDVWCLVATPYKAQNRDVARNGVTRRVSGAKGLGRLSVGRLGKGLTLLTKARGAPCWQVMVNWDEIAAGDHLDDSTVELRQRSSTTLRHESGTLLRIHTLKSQWSPEQCEQLKDNLSRLVSPFREVDDFAVHLSADIGQGWQTDISITSPPFLAEPKYSIRGEACAKGNFTALYQYRSVNTTDRREQGINRIWSTIDASRRHATCGPFSFDIRAWDISADGTREISDRYGLRRRSIRPAIRAHKGISVYRDGILVLPKSEDARDWLGLDLRRVSHVGVRMSTNQIVGYVSITADENPDIEDTSDRERLASSQAVDDFQKILREIVGELEKERDNDRAKDAKETPMEDILGGISAAEAIRDVRALAKAGGKASKAVPILRSLDRALLKTREDIAKRFTYYSRLATVGTVAQMLVHEIRNRTTALGRFLRMFKGKAKDMWREQFDTPYKMANESIVALERLADVFAPLASRTFKRGVRSAVLEERIAACIDLQREEIRQARILYSIPGSKTAVAVDPGELDAVILNLLTNSIYWLGQVEERGPRELKYELSIDHDEGQVYVRTLDTGPGIAPDDVERVFWPGVTRKPDGIGMGLTVASELVAAYGGRMALEEVDTGACFTFGLPLARGEARRS